MAGVGPTLGSWRLIKELLGREGQYRINVLERLYAAQGYSASTALLAKPGTVEAIRENIKTNAPTYEECMSEKTIGYWVVVTIEGVIQNIGNGEQPIFIPAPNEDTALVKAGSLMNQYGIAVEDAEFHLRKF